jgi:hypothetical protein
MLGQCGKVLEDLLEVTQKKKENNFCSIDDKEISRLKEKKSQ